ncbi:NUDIX hydrolase [Leptolyngbya sp. CCY15150]|uniref:NUDIX domain-containing protein n=1 Tax=Leptolyngbya sp. CCY15150 TaxID=2767772 RepID=UPI00194F83B9|nr:NUDIX hydrolase [Leptolyngbya sp. CCY15150]
MSEPLVFKNRPNQPIVVEGKTYWISRSVTVVPVLLFAIERQLYVPLGKRGIDMPNEQGKWGLPGGYLDFDETTSEAVIREVYEETGLNLPYLMAHHRVVGDLEHPYLIESRPLYLQNVSLRFPLMIFVDDLPPLAAKVGVGEVEELRWVPVEEAIAQDLAFEHHLLIQHCLETYFCWNQAGDRTL